jgi:REP element-mobilizing transposase RayT
LWGGWGQPEKVDTRREESSISGPWPAACALRIVLAGASYHITARDNRRERIFRDDSDRRFFPRTLGEACARTGWRVHAWVLMSTHYHLLIETPQSNLMAGMGALQNTYTRSLHPAERSIFRAGRGGAARPIKGRHEEGCHVLAFRLTSMNSPSHLGSGCFYDN